MYQNKKYIKNDAHYVFRFIRQYPFATLVLQDDMLIATHIPILAEDNEEELVLYGHIANNNPMVHSLQKEKDILLIFQSAHGYVSSSWYKEKDISTWDYSAVHINAKLHIQSQAELQACLVKLVERFEKDQEHPLFFHDIPKKMIDDHLPHITGFWCKPVKIEAIAKFHQGFARDDIESITTHLQRQGSPLGRELSKLIKKEHGTDH